MPKPREPSLAWSNFSLMPATLQTLPSLTLTLTISPCRHGASAGSDRRTRDVQDAKAVRAELGLVELLADARYPNLPYLVLTLTLIIPPCRHGATAGSADGRARDVQDAKAARAELGLVELLADARLRREEDVTAARGQPQAVVGRPAHVLHAPRPARAPAASRHMPPWSWHVPVRLKEFLGEATD